MAPLFGSNDEHAVQWHLPKVYELGLIDAGEIVCEVEGAIRDDHPGVLVVTDLQVIHLDRGIFGPTTYAVRLADVVDAEVYEPRGFRLLSAGAGLALATRRAGSANWVDIGQFRELLADGERALALEEEVWLGLRDGRLLVTDRRVAFLMGGVLWHRRVVIELAWAEIGSVAVKDGERGGRANLELATKVPVRSNYLVAFDVAKGGAAELEQLIESAMRGERPDPPPMRVEFEGIKGDQERAGQIARTIMRQKEFLERRLPVAVPELAEVEVDAPLPPVRVALGRGVVAWVSDRGGELYVWGDPFSEGFDVMRASARPPAGVSFVPSDAVSGFRLFVEADMAFSSPIRLRRRWFGLRDGITVDTGVVVGGVM